MSSYTKVILDYPGGPDVVMRSLQKGDRKVRVRVGNGMTRSRGWSDAAMSEEMQTAS